ncbi:MAG: family 16 glycoside hydrolase [Halioglobus sp.]
MKKMFFLLLIAVLGVAAYWVVLKPAGSAFELEEGYVSLYDGKSLDGWRTIGGDSTFEPDGESIKGTHGPGENTFLRTEKTFADFNLRMQMRWDELGNSGVLFRAQQRDGDGRAYGYQYELDHSDRSWSAGIYDEARRGWIYNLENDEAAREAIKLDDWNDIEISARGGTLKTWINGVVAATTIDAFDAEGFIALQVHSGDVGIMRWRHIRIQELEPLAQAGKALLADDWELDGLSDIQVEEANVSGTLDEQEGWLSPRRRFADVSVQFSVPACENPTVIRMRYDGGEMNDGESFVEATIYADRAAARHVTPDTETVMEELRLAPADRHQFTGITIGDSATLSVGEEDLLRVLNVGSALASRGKLQVKPADCGDRFELGQFAWTNLQENREEVAFYKTLDNAPAPVLSPEEALAAFRIAPGFEIELVAAEPLVEDPVAMAWDEYGRLYVVEMRGYMPDAYGSGSEEPVGQVVRLEDVDGDGRMDTSEVFLGSLVNPRAVAVVNEGVLIGEPPNLWLCATPSRDALCEQKRSVGGYAQDAANVEHMENRLLPGLDNWLYNSKSKRRLRLTDGVLQESEGPFRGQWGISKDDYGRLYYNNNSNWLLTDFFQGDDLVEPDVVSYPAGIGVNLTDPSPVYTVRVNPGVNRAYLEGTLRKDGRLNNATGASGLAIYRGDQFPQAYRGHAFVPESAGNVVAQFALSEQEVGVTAEQQLYPDEQWGQRDFLGSTDERFRPVDAANGPDGSLYVIDMYRGIIQDDHFLTDELREQIFERGLDKPVGKGRIWRIRHTEGEQARTTTTLGDASPLDLVAALSDNNGWVRDTAQRLLLKAPLQKADGLEALAMADNTIPALHAIWTLHGRNELTAAAIDKLLRSEDPQRQIHALRASVGLLTAQQLVAASDVLLAGPEPVVMQYAFALGAQSSDPAARNTLSQILSGGADSVYIRQAVVRALRNKEQTFLQEMFAADGLDVESEGAALALRALASGAYRTVRPDMSSDSPIAPEMLDLLALVESRQGDKAWQQLALLSGFSPLARTDGFVPAGLDAAPSIFADTNISEKDPLWNARLVARVAFTWPGDELALGIKPLSPEQMALMEVGRNYYPSCANCHGASGAGTAGLAPALAGASWVTGPPEWLARIILQGINGPIEVNGEQWNGIMPPHGHLAELDDETLAGLMLYLRRSWGNKADPVSVEQVAAMRVASADRKQPWTVEELESVPFDRGYGRFVGQYSVSFVTMTIEETPEGLYLSVPLYGEGILEQVSETEFRGSTGSDSIELDFVLEDEGPAKSFIIFRDGEKITFKRKK